MQTPSSPLAISQHALEQTIAAVATPPGESGLAVIRLSGPAAVMVCDRIFRAGKNFQQAAEMAPYTLSKGTILDGQGRPLDEVLIAAFFAPRSYTGEDLIEISCHGGPAIKQAIMGLLLEQGVREAGPGEFTKRAFLHGKLDLMQAEAVMDMIHAENEAALRVAAQELAGKGARSIARFTEGIYALQAALERLIEFPEYEEERLPSTELQERLQDLRGKAEAALATWRDGRILFEGFRVVLAGRPNVGKSSLLNALVGTDRAIVDDQAGTTRDVIEVRRRLQGQLVLYSDTAGLRATADRIEHAGVSRAETALKEADLVLWLMAPDGSVHGSLVDEWAQLERLKAEGKEVLLLFAKQDLAEARALKARLYEEAKPFRSLAISTLEAESLRKLEEAIASYFPVFDQEASRSLLLHNLRHKGLFERASQALGMADEALCQGLPLELVASQLRMAQECFAELSGEQVSDRLAEEIFSRFCVGK